VTGSSRAPLVDAADVAVYLAVERGWVYANADRLGARKLGDGPRARLRFDLEEVDRRLASCSEGRESDEPAGGTVTPIKPRRRRGRSGTCAPLLPIRGVDGA
jgi:hypothetical protein